MKKILFLALGYPDVNKSTILYTDLMQQFAHEGHQVLVLAPALKNGDYGLRKEGLVDVIRVKTLPLFDIGTIKKGIANVLLPFQYKKAFKKYSGAFDFDVVIFPTPPITLISVASWFKKKANCKIYLILRDIFPQNAVDLKMMSKGGLLHQIFKSQEKKLYKVADSIGCMSKANVDYVKRNNGYFDHKKLHLLPNWENIPKEIPLEEIASVAEKYGIKDKFVAIFGGNLGKPQKMENIVELAKNCAEYDGIHFLILGSGTEKEKISKLIEKYGLSNIRLMNHLPKKDYIRILAASDVGLISLSDEFTIPNFPSKVNTYFGLKKPVLASIDLSTDFGIMLTETNSGLWSEAGKIEDFKANLLSLYENKEGAKKMGQNGYEYMKLHLTPNIACNTILSHI